MGKARLKCAPTPRLMVLGPGLPEQASKHHSSAAFGISSCLQIPVMCKILTPFDGSAVEV